MILLDATTKSLEVVLAGAVTTTQLPFNASYADVNQTTFAITATAATDGATNSTTAVTLVAAPSASRTRKVSLVEVYNADTVAATVTVRLNNNSTLRIMVRIALAVGSTLQYTDGGGWKVIDANGSIVGSSTNVLLDGTIHSDTVAQSVTRGSLVYGNSTPKWDEFVVGGANSVLKSDGTDFSWAASTGTGSPVLATSPTLVTPDIGAATGTSLILTGDFSLGGGDLIATANTVIRRNTSDGSDNGSLQLAAGGAAGLETRGAYIDMFGNEHASTGKLNIGLGNAAGSTLNLFSGVTTMASFSGADGSVAFTSSMSTGSGFVFNGSSGAAMLLPRMTTTVRDAMTSVNGMIIYNTTTATFQGYEAGAWNNFGVL